ncbi:MAG: helix-turn-helix transcriptional regulator [Pleurocapsa sp. SU_196_0]|nr:helix-turn-helix transcriptional regulator [Pleurocapsa sp. SU_196_0]
MMPTVGARILYWRLVRGLSRADVGTRIGWTKSNYSLRSHEEGGIAEDARLGTLQRIANAVEVDICALVSGELPDDAGAVLERHGFRLTDSGVERD